MFYKKHKNVFLPFYSNPKCQLFPLSIQLCVSCQTSTDRSLTCTGYSMGYLISHRTAQRLEVRSVPVPVHQHLWPIQQKIKNWVVLYFYKVINYLTKRSSTAILYRYIILSILNKLIMRTI